MSRQSIQAGKAVIVVDLVDKATASFKKMQSGLMNASRAFRDIGTNAAGAALLTGVPIAKGLGNYARFTNEIQNIEAKLGNFGKTSNIVRQNSIELRSEIIKLGRDTAYTSEEVAKAAGVLAQGGLEEFGGGTIKASLKSIIDLGRGTKLHLEDAADMAVSIATTFDLITRGMDTTTVSKNMSQLADQIVKAGRLSIAGADDLSASLVYVAQSGAKLKATVPEILTLLNRLAQKGIKGSVAGTSLNTAFINLLNNAEKIKEKFPNFNNVLKADGTVDLIETFGKLGTLMKTLSAQDQVQFLADIFNLRGQRAASALDDVEELRIGLTAIKDSANEASKSSQTMQAGFGGALERMGGAVDALQIKLGVRFDKVLKGTTEIIALMIDKVSELSIKYLALTATILLSPVIFAATAVGALSLSFILARLSVVVGLVLKGFKGLKSVGSIMLGGAKSLASPLAAMANSRSIKAAAIKKTSAKIAALQTALDISYAKASAKKVGAASAIAKIAASKKQAQLISSVSSLRNLQSGGILSRGKTAYNTVARTAESFGKAINQKIRTIALVVAERKEIKAQVAIERQRAALAGKSVLIREPQRLKQIVALNKASIAAKHKALRLTQMAARSQHGLNELTFLQTKVNPARERAIQLAYDKLFKTRQQLKEVPEFNKVGGQSVLSQQRINLLKEEAALAKFINTEQAKQSRIASRIFIAERNIASTKAQAAKQLKLSTAYSEKAVRVGKQITVGEKINAAAQARNTLSVSRLARAGTALKSASLGKAIFSGANLGKTFATLGKSISIVARLAFSFTRLSLSITRFVFSWNFVGIALNALLLFGDKIPAVRKAFTDLGSAFSSAFAQIGKIATYATPAFNLFGLAIEAFASGNSAIGIGALAAGFDSIVSIISNQLTAAWNAFAAKVTDLWMSIKQIGGSLVIVFTSLFAGLGEIFGNAFQGISERVSKLFSGEGESTFFSVIELMALTMNNFITEFSKAIINLQDWSGQFLNRLEDLASGKKIIDKINPKTYMDIVIDSIDNTSILGSLKNDEQEKRGRKKPGELLQNPRINDLETARLKREKDILDLFSDKGNKAERDSEVEIANIASEIEHAIATRKWNELKVALNKIIADGTAAAQEAAGKKPFVENNEQGDSPDVQRFIMKLDSLVGSLGETRNIYRIDKDSQILETRRTNELLREQTRVIQTQGMIGN